MKNNFNSSLSFLSQTVISQGINQRTGLWHLNSKVLTPITDPKFKDLINGFKEASFTF
jgi:hypothetical protein